MSDPKAVAKASSEYNTTVYVGGIEKGRVNDASLREQFSRFGPIDGKNKIRSFKSLYQRMNSIGTIIFSTVFFRSTLV